MSEHRYPVLEIDKKKLAENIEEITDRCSARGISVAGIIKGMNGLTGLIDVYAGSSVSMIGSSRIEQIMDVKAFFSRHPEQEKPTMMIRIPMISEAEDIVRYCDYSLESEDEVIRALNEEALSQGKIHKVILMAEMGDLREGYLEEALVRAALMVENDLKGLELSGVGMNVGCYGSILPTREKLDEFVSRAEKVEKAIGRRLDIISGGATSTLMRVLDGDIPERINHLRIGEGILLARDLPLFYGCNLPFMHQDVFRLKMEIIELKKKPTFPIGTVGRDAFGHMPEYVDSGERMRALAGCGKVDYGSEYEIFPLEKGIKVIGASSDHTILDVEDAERDLKVGDVLEFGIDYASLVFVTASRGIRIEYR